jgi:hypothetical protein
MWNLHFFSSIAALTVFSGLIPAVDADSSIGINSQAGATAGDLAVVASQLGGGSPHNVTASRHQIPSVFLVVAVGVMIRTIFSTAPFSGLRKRNKSQNRRRTALLQSDSLEEIPLSEDAAPAKVKEVSPPVPVVYINHARRAGQEPSGQQ